jgi:hypothetical protein
MPRKVIRVRDEGGDGGGDGESECDEGDDCVAWVVVRVCGERKSVV